MIQLIERQFVRTTRPLYGHLVSLLESAISRGDLPSGARVPPERELAQRLQISRTTVVSAYRELESRGLLRGYVGRGTFVARRARSDWRALRLAGQDRRGRAAVERFDAERPAPPLVGCERPVARRRRAGDRLFPVRRSQQAIDYALQRERPGGLAARTDRRTAARCATRLPSASAFRPKSCSCSPARSRVSTSSPAVSSIRATR